jgi:hypothetical protein
LLNAVLSALSVYWISVHAMPAWVRKEIDRIRRSWLWRGEETCHGGHCKVAWSRICRPKELGGLGIVDLDRFGTALRLKWLWLERTAPEKPWAGMPLPCSLADRHLFAAATSVTIGDGATARFWFDSWMDGRAPLTAFADLFLVSRRKHRSVYEAVHDQRWVADLRGRVTPELLPAFVSLWTAVAALQFLPGAADSFTWRCSPSGSYSASSAYRMQFLGSTRSPLMPTIWQAWAPAKCRLLAWLFVQNRVLTADRLLARRWPNSYFCPLCMRNLETAEHLLVECPWSTALWFRVADKFGAATLRPDTWSLPLASLPSWLASLSALVGDPAKTAKSLAMLVIWAIWRERNARIFRGSRRSPDVAAREVFDEAAAWALAGCRHIRCRE